MQHVELFSSIATSVQENGLLASRVVNEELQELIDQKHVAETNHRAIYSRQ